MIHDGSRVSFVGHPSDGLGIGDHGRVFQAGASGSHVKWASGERRGEIDLIRNDDLVEMPTTGSLTADAITEPGLVSFAVRAVHSTSGDVGVLNALNAEGHLESFEDIAEDALAFVSSRIRQDPSFVEVLGQLEPDDGDDLVALAASTLLRDAFART